MPREIVIPERRVALEQSRVNQSAAVTPARAEGVGGLLAISNALEQASGVAAKWMGVAQQEQAQQVERDSAAAGSEYGLNTPLAEIHLPTGSTVGEVAFRKSAIVAASATADLAVRENIEAVAALHPGQPEAFKAAIGEASKKFLAGLPADMRPDVAASYARLQTQRYLELDKDRKEFVTDQTLATITQASEVRTTAAAKRARLGDMPGALAETAELAKLYAAAGPLAAGGSGALTLTKIEAASIEAMDVVRTNFLEGWVERTPNKRAALAGLQKGHTGSGPVDAVLAVTGPDLIDKLSNQLEAEVHRQEAEARAAQAEARADARVLFEDEMAAAGDGAVANPDTTRIITRAFGPGKAAPLLKRIEDVRKGVAIANNFGTMTIPEMDEAIGTMAPAGADYKDEAHLRDGLLQIKEKVLDARVKDPAAAVAGSHPNIATKLASNDPAVVGEGMRQSIQVQAETFGIAPGNIRVLTPALTDRILDGFKGAATADERLGALGSYTTALKNDEVARKVLSELEAKGLPHDARFALEQMQAGNLPAARELMGGINVDPKDLPKLGPDKASEVAGAVDTIMGAPGPAGVTTRLANMSRQPGMFSRATAERATLQRLATQYAAGGDDAATAASKAERTVFGDTKVAGDADLGYVRVPAAVDEDAMTAGLEAARASVDLSYLTPRTGNMQADRDRAAWAQGVRDGGIWSDAEGGYVLMAPEGGFIPAAPGSREPRVWTSAEIMQAAAEAKQRALDVGKPRQLPADPWAPMAPPGEAPVDPMQLGAGDAPSLDGVMENARLMEKLNLKVKGDRRSANVVDIRKETHEIGSADLDGVLTIMRRQYVEMGKSKDEADAIVDNYQAWMTQQDPSGELHLRTAKGSALLNVSKMHP